MLLVQYEDMLCHRVEQWDGGVGGGKNSLSNMNGPITLEFVERMATVSQINPQFKQTSTLMTLRNQWKHRRYGLWDFIKLSIKRNDSITKMERKLVSYLMKQTEDQNATKKRMETTKDEWIKENNGQTLAIFPQLSCPNRSNAGNYFLPWNWTYATLDWLYLDPPGINSFTTAWEIKHLFNCVIDNTNMPMCTSLYYTVSEISRPLKYTIDAKGILKHNRVPTAQTSCMIHR